MPSLRAREMRYPAAAVVAAACILPALFGFWLSRQVDHRWLAAAFALSVLHVSWNNWRPPHTSGVKRPRAPACVRDGASGSFVWTASCARSLANTGGLAGLLSSLLGVGGGYVIMQFLQRGTDLHMKSTLATSLTVVFLIALNGVAINIASNRLQWSIALPFCAGTLVNMLGCRILAVQIVDTGTRRCFTALAVAVAVAVAAAMLTSILRFILEN